MIACQHLQQLYLQLYVPLTPNVACIHHNPTTGCLHTCLPFNPIQTQLPSSTRAQRQARRSHSFTHKTLKTYVHHNKKKYAEGALRWPVSHTFTGVLFYVSQWKTLLSKRPSGGLFFWGLSTNGGQQCAQPWKLRSETRRQ